MKKLLLIIGVLVFFTGTSYSQRYYCNNGQISFFQETPIENIEGKSNTLISIIDKQKNEIAYKVKMTSFIFDKALMQDHFNENYVESEKFPFATYQGEINENIDWSVNGTYNISSTGILTMHGISKTITEKGSITINGDKIKIVNNFKIKFTDFNVEIPKLLISQLTDVVDIKIETNYSILNK